MQAQHIGPTLSSGYYADLLGCLIQRHATYNDKKRATIISRAAPDRI